VNKSYQINQSIFEYQNKPKTYFTHNRDKMLGYIPKNAKCVLDVGCGSGSFGELMKSLSKVEIWGIEIAEDVAKEAMAKIDRVIIADVEKDNLNLLKDYFDCIVFNDVLEHLCNPWNVLVRCKAFLKKAGYIVASVPNIRYYPHIRSLLVEKNWEYEDEGILDKTHLRFFTERSIKDMFLKCGYSIIKIEGINEMKFSKKLKVLNFFLKNSLDDMKYLQFAVLAQKRD
jgi:2-polyprenyl-3-methyl-5-hydroxy-6-metoxy-1,4-benzoquinol methylase